MAEITWIEPIPQRVPCLEEALPRTRATPLSWGEQTPIPQHAALDGGSAEKSVPGAVLRAMVEPDQVSIHPAFHKSRLPQRDDQSWKGAPGFDAAAPFLAWL